MPTIQQLRQEFPEYDGLSDTDIINDVAKTLGRDPVSAASWLGVQVNDPGFASTVKRSGAQMLGATGEIYGDITGNRNNAVSNWAQDVEFRNPSGINSLEDVANNPWLATKEAVGNAATFLIPGAGLKLAGGALRGAKMANAARAVDNPLTQAALAGAPSLSEIGDMQRESGDPENLALKYAGALGVGAIENLGGVQRMMGLGRAPQVLSKADEVAQFGASPWRTAGKTMLRSAAEEGLEEIPQTFIEKGAGYQDPFSRANLEEAALGGVMGAIGGGVLGGGYGAQRGLRHAAINRQMSADLLNPDATSFGNLRESADWKREFLARDEGRDQGDNWYNDFMRSRVDSLMGQDARAASHAAQLRFMDGVNGVQDDGSEYGPFGTPVFDYLGGIQDRQRIQREMIPGVEAQHLANAYLQQEQELGAQPDLMTHAGVQVPGSFNYNVGLPLQQQLLAEEESGYAPTQVAQGSNQVPGVVSGGGAGNLGNQPSVGRGGNPVAGTPALSSGANPSVGSGGAGVVAVTPETQGFSKKQRELWTTAVTTLGEGHLALEGINQLVAENKHERAKKAIVAAQAETPAQVALPKVQQKVFDHLKAAFDSGNIDSALGVNGFKTAEIAAALGVDRGSITTAVKGMRKHLTRFKPDVDRTVQAADADKLGLSPAKQNTGVVSEADLFGNEDGADQSMGIIESVGGSQSAVGENVAPPDDQGVITAEEIERDERIAASAQLNADLFFDEMLSHPEARNAAIDWEDTKKPSSPSFNELTRGEQAELIDTYSVAAEEGDWDTIEAALKRFENSLEASRDVQPKTAPRITRATNPTETQRSLPEVRSEVSPVEEGQPVSDGAVERRDPEGQSGEVAGNPIERRVEALKSTLGEKQRAAVDRLVNRYTSGDITLERLEGELDNYDAQVEEGIKYSTGASGQSDAKTIASRLSKLFFSPEKFTKLVTVVQTPEELPAEVREAAAEDANMSVSDVPWDGVQGFAVNGKVYLIADNIADGRELAVFLHEVGVHIGMSKLIGQTNMTHLALQIKRWAIKNDGSQESKLAKAALDRIKSARRNGVEMNESDVIEERIAYFIEEAVKAGIDPTAIQKTQGPLANWFRTLWAAAKVALRKIGLYRFEDLTAQNMVDLAYGAAKIEMTGTWHGTAADFRNFNHEYMGSGEGAQAYGWGTYLAQKVGIAKQYWKDDVRRKGKYGGFFYDGQHLGSISPDETDPLKVAKVVFVAHQAGLAPDTSAETIDDIYAVDRDVAEKAAELAKTLDPKKVATSEKPDGSLMRVDTAVHDDELLDWDKPLSEQSEYVKSIILKSKDKDTPWIDRHPEYAPIDWVVDGEDVYGSWIVNGLEDYYEDARAASEYLDGLGIKGIKFLDATSRLGKAYDNYPRASKFNDAIAADDMLGFDSYGEVRSMIKRDGLAEAQQNFDMSPELVAEAKAWLDWFAKPVEGTRNLVIFNDKNVQRVATQVAAKRDHVKFSISEARIEEVTGKMPPAMRDWSYKTAINLVDIAKRGVYSVAFGHDLATLVKKYLPSASKYFDIKSKQGAELTHMESVINDILERAHVGSDIDKLNAFLNKSTREKKWGYDVKKKDGSVLYKADPAMAAEFNALSKESQAAAKEIFQHGYENIKALNALVKSELDEYDTTGMTPDEVKKLEAKKRRSMALFDKTFKALSGPYAPLVRIGNFVAAAKSQEYLDAVATNDDAALEKLRQDPKHYFVEFHESLGDAKVAARKMAQTGNYAEVDGFAKEHFYNKANETPWAALKRVAKMIEPDEDASKADRKIARNMKNLLNDLYFSSLAEGSARQFQNTRRNVHGETPDMLRAFAIKGRADANFITQLKYGKQVLDSINTMRREVSESKVGERSDRIRALNEILGRQAASMEYRQEPALAKLQGVTSFWMLATNPAYYIQNATQPFMMTLPWLAGRYGYGQSSKVFFDAYKALTKGKLDPNQMPISDAEKATLASLKNDGILDIGINREMGYWANSDNKAINFVAETQHFFNKKIQQLEMVNRMSSALAAYRLSGGKIDAAREVIRVTHGDYSQFNEPGFFSKVPGARLILQFRKFQIIQLSMMARLISQSNPWGKASAEEKAVARKSLGFLLGHVSLMAGGLGLPLANLIGPLVAAALGEPGDPDDEEYLLRKLIDDKDLADLLLRGVPAAVGVNMSSRLGMQNMTSITPFAQKDPLTKEGFNERVVALAGPWAGLGAKVVDGVGKVLEGDVMKGTEQMLPSLLSNSIKAYRFSTEGVTLKNGDVVMSPEDISIATATMQALGLPTTALTDRQRVQGNLIEFEKGFKDRASELKKDYSEAVKQGGGTDGIREEWSVMVAAMQRNGFKPPALSELLKAPMEQRKREASVVNGVETKKSNRAFAAGAN